jgi:hypothetical protein
MAVLILARQYYSLRPYADVVEAVRSIALPLLDPVIERHFGSVGAAYEISESELVGVLDAPLPTVRRWLWAARCRLNLLSAEKSLPDGRQQIGAFVYRGPAVPERKQVDVMLFRAPGGRVAVAAHLEHSSALHWLWRDPEVLRKHYQGVEYDPDAGERILVESILPDARWVR